MKPLIIGHRGASAVAPENTLAAFRAAIAAGADGVEFDVRLSQDGAPVIIHDETLRRTAGLPVRVSDLTLADLKKVDVGTWFSRNRRLAQSEFSMEKVPALNEAFALFASNNSILYLEMKGSSAEQSQLAKACCELLRNDGLKERVVIESFDIEALEKVKAIDPLLKTAALFEPSLSRLRLPTGRNIVEEAKAVGANEIALHSRLVTERLVERAKIAGLTIVVWTVDNLEWIQCSQTLGIDVLITNNPAPMVAHRDRIYGD